MHFDWSIAVDELNLQYVWLTPCFIRIFSDIECNKRNPRPSSSVFRQASKDVETVDSEVGFVSGLERELVACQAQDYLEPANAEQIPTMA